MWLLGDMKYLPLFLLLITITACGFSPVYGTKSVSNNLSDIQVSIIPNREGQIVRNHLIDRLYQDGYPQSAAYKLDISAINEDIVEIGIDRDDEASRAQLRLYANYTLVDLSNNQTIMTRTARVTTGYNILAGQFTTFVTKEDARKQGLKALSENIITQLEIHFK